MKTKLSICIVAYHNYEDIEKAVSSIERHTNSEIQKKIFIVDNGESHDSEATSFRNKLGKYEDIEYLDVGKNVGFGRGNNYVINLLDSDYHAIVNPDIVLREDSFKKIIEFMNNNPQIGMCIPKIITESGEMQYTCREELTVFDMFARMFARKIFPRRVAKHEMQDRDYTQPFHVPFGQGSFLVIRTELFKRLRGFDDSFFMYIEDADLCRRVNLVSQLVYYPGTSVIHRWEQGSHKNMKLFKYHLKSMSTYFSKWGYVWI